MYVRTYVHLLFCCNKESFVDSLKNSGGGVSGSPQNLFLMLSCCHGNCFHFIGDQVKPLFSSFGLPAQTLSQIW